MQSIGQSRDDRYKIKNMFNEIVENNVYKDQKLKINAFSQRYDFEF